MSSTSFNSKMSLYIPRVFANISEERIIKIIEKDIELGKVNNIDIVSKIGSNGQKYNGVYIHFEYWNETATTINFQARIMEGESAKIVYEDPWFWLVLENKGKKHISGDRKICIDVRDDTSISIPFTLPPRLTRSRACEEYTSNNEEQQEKQEEQDQKFYDRKCAITGLKLPIYSYSLEDKLEFYNNNISHELMEMSCEIENLRYEIDEIKRQNTTNQRTMDTNSEYISDAV